MHLGSGDKNLLGVSYDHLLVHKPVAGRGRVYVIARDDLHCLDIFHHRLDLLRFQIHAAGSQTVWMPLGGEQETHQRRCPPQIVFSFPLANLIRYAFFGSWKNKSTFTATSQTVICLLTSRVIMCWKKAAIFFWCDQGGSHEEQFPVQPTRAPPSRKKIEPNLKKGSW